MENRKRRGYLALLLALCVLVPTLVQAADEPYNGVSYVLVPRDYVGVEGVYRLNGRSAPYNPLVAGGQKLFDFSFTGVTSTVNGLAVSPVAKLYLFVCPAATGIYTDVNEVGWLPPGTFPLVFMEQRVRGGMQLWAEPFTSLRVPKIFNLRTDPFEFADVTSNTYWDWLLDHSYLLVPAQQIVGQFLATFMDYPPRQKAASFSMEQVLEKLTAGLGSK